MIPLEHYPQPEFEVLDDRVPLWRFFKWWTFTKLIESGNLYFSRADLLGDEHEGLPLEDYARHVVNQMGPGNTFEDTWQNLKDERQGSFVCCFTLDETIRMWEKFAPEGVAITTTTALLKATLKKIPERAIVGYVRYSPYHEGFNILRFITTKRPEFRREAEVRALLWDLNRSPRNPMPHDMPDGLVYPVDIRTFVQSVLISPTAPAALHSEVLALLNKYGYSGISVVRSKFTEFSHLLPNVDDIDKYS